MKAIKLHFNRSFVNANNIKVISILLVLLLTMLLFSMLRNTDTLITHKEANTLFMGDRIQKVILDGEYVRIKTEAGQYKIYKEAINQNAFFTKYPVEVIENKSSFYDIFSLFILVGAFWLFFRFMQQSKKQQLHNIKAINADNTLQNKPIEAIKPQVTFEEVAGIKDVKEELEEIIDFLKAPKKYRDLDIRLPKGVLLVGPPGVGKTLISKAVAGEAGVPFFYQSGASFVHIYVGMGAKRVSELFQKAKQSAPSIIFIDEIDAVGKSRGEFGNDEREATLNQLLTEMDGFEESSGVIVIAATNKVEVLDEALLRAGRFDRRIHISLPDLADRCKTLELYLAAKPNDVDIAQVARMTVGFNFAALDTLTNEATIHAMREGRSNVETSDFEAVKDKVLLGKRKVLIFTEKEREIQAVYQAAKAVIATWLDLEFTKIGIVNTQVVNQEHEILSRSKLINQVKFYLAGSVATKLHYNEQFSNASTDIQKAKNLVHKVIYEYAMGDNFIFTPQQEEVLLSECVSEVTELLKTLQIALDKITQYLLEYENIGHEECKEILRDLF